jgi:hypothetical protein
MKCTVKGNENYGHTSYCLIEVVPKAGLTVDLCEGIQEDVNIYLKGGAQKSKRGEEIYRGGVQ